jgi:hypothetical protein
MDAVFEPGKEVGVEMMMGPQLMARRANLLAGEAGILSMNLEEQDQESLAIHAEQLENIRLEIFKTDYLYLNNELREARMLPNTEGLRLALANIARFAVILVRVAEELDWPGN